MGGLGLAACVLLGLVVIEIDPVLWWRAEHWTAAGERRTVHLPDSSVAHLNSRTALASHYTEAARRIEILAGEAQFAVHGDGRPGDIARLTAWRRGKLVFESTPLAQVIAEINQHRPGHVALMSSALRVHRVSGVFAIDKIDAVLAVISKTLPVRSYSVAGRYVLLY